MKVWVFGYVLFKITAICHHLWWQGFCECILCMCMCTLTSFPSRAAASNKVNALMYIHTYIFFENFTLFFLMFLRSLFLLLSYICRYVRERALAICLSFALLHYQTVKIIWVCCPCVCVCLRIGVQTHTIIFRSSKKKKKICRLDSIGSRLLQRVTRFPHISWTLNKVTFVKSQHTHT